MRQIELYVPIQDNQGKPIPECLWETLHDALLVMGGGFTRYQAHGSWRNDPHNITESVTIYRVLTDSQHALTDIQNTADFVKRCWQQESVLYTVQDVQATFV